MTIKDLLNEMFGSVDLDAGLLWDETPIDVKDSHTGEKSKLPIDTDDYREDKKRKKRRQKRSNKSKNTLSKPSG